MTRFKARIEPIRGGGHYVVVPDEVAARAGVAFRMRVRGTMAGQPYRASLARYSGAYHVAVLTAAMKAARARAGDVVVMTLERDDEPLPGDVIPDELEAALSGNAAARAAWDRLAPSRRREHEKYIIEAKREETRIARAARVLAMLAAPRPRKTWPR